MFSENNKKVQPKTKTKHTLFQKSSREWHHHHLVLLLGMFGSGMLFLFVLVAYFATRPPSEELHVSKYFTYSTALLLFSSYPISRLTVSFDKEKGRQILKSLMVSAFAGSIFILLQHTEWISPKYWLPFGELVSINIIRLWPQTLLGDIKTCGVVKVNAHADLHMSLVLQFRGMRNRTKSHKYPQPSAHLSPI